LEHTTLKLKSSGALFLSKSSKRFLLLQKSSGKKEGIWGLVGGKINPDESVWQGLCREIVEEIGFMPETIKSFPLEMFVSDDYHFNFQTYICIVREEFIPQLSDEHMGWAWCQLDKWPRPVHQGIKNTVGSKIIRAKLETIFEMVDLIKSDS
jgi:8-oxo-dGTP pyrophosphatase MutT (NUDIX family)